MPPRLEFLKKIALFSDLTSEELELVASNAEEKVIESGKTLFQENSPRSELFLIIDGEVEIFKTSPFGDEKRLSFFSKYDFLGEGSLMDDSPHSTSARTLLKTTTLTITKEKYDKLTSSHWEIAIKILSRVARVISRRMKHTNYRVVNTGAQYESGRTRAEHDLLGNRDVPHERFYGIQTLRAIENFNISGITLNCYHRYKTNPFLAIRLTLDEVACV